MSDPVPPPPVSAPAPPPASQPKNQQKEQTQSDNAPVKSILFISGQFFPFVQWLNRVTEMENLSAQEKRTEKTRIAKIKKVWLTSPKVKESMDFATQKSYDLVETFENFGINGNVELRAHELNKTYKFTHVINLSEEDMIRAATLREHFKLPTGQTLQSTLRFRDKILMKNCVSKAGCKVPAYASVENATDLYEFIEKHGYPVVVKPIRGYGSINTTVIRDEPRLEEFCANGFGGVCDSPLDMMVESFVNGQMYHIDGFVYKNEARLIWPSCYVNTVVEFSSNPFIAGYSLQPTNPLLRRIQEFVRNSLFALHAEPYGPSMYPFHAEVWVTPENEIVFCEVASRTGGGGIPTQILSLFGVSLSVSHTQYQAGEQLTLESAEVTWDKRLPIIPESVGWVYIYPKVGVLTMPKVCTEPYVLSYEPYAESGEIYRNRKSCADAVCNFLVAGNSELETKNNIAKVYEWFQKNSKWDPLPNDGETATGGN